MNISTPFRLLILSFILVFLSACGESDGIYENSSAADGSETTTIVDSTDDTGNTDEIGGTNDTGGTDTTAGEGSSTTVLESVNQVAPVLARVTGYWPFDEGSGTTAVDLSGNQQTGVLSGTTWTSDAAYGTGVCFSGQSSQRVTTLVDVPTPAAFTISAWIKVDPALNTGAGIVAFGDSLGFWVDAGGRLILYIWNGTGWQPLTVTAEQMNLNRIGLKDGQWHHVAGSYDPTSGFAIFVDGQLISTSAAKGSISYSRGSEFNIGTIQGWRAFNGCLDEVQFYSTALDAVDIATLAQLPDGSQTNSAPIVTAGADQTTFLPDDTVTVVTSISDDSLSTGGDLAIQWSQISSPSVTLPEPPDTGTDTTTFFFNIPGIYEFELSASDGVLSTTDTVSIVVE